MHISLYFSLYLLTTRLLLLECLLALLLLVLLVLLQIPGRLPLYNSPPPPHETSGGSTSIAEELVGGSGLWVCELQTCTQGRQV
jgi:hypothetical protein